MTDPYALRLHVLWERRANTSVLTIPRLEWDRLSLNTTGPVPIDINDTPMADVASDASLLATVAHQYSSSSGEVIIYRYDQKDQPTPVNVDHYSVLLDLESHPRLDQFISDASTEKNANLLQYVGQNVFLVKQKPGGDHWLPKLPGSVVAVITDLSAASEGAV